MPTLFAKDKVLFPSLSLAGLAAGRPGPYQHLHHRASSCLFCFSFRSLAYYYYYYYYYYRSVRARKRFASNKPGGSELRGGGLAPPPPLLEARATLTNGTMTNENWNRFITFRLNPLGLNIIFVSSKHALAWPPSLVEDKIEVGSF